MRVHACLSLAAVLWRFTYAWQRGP